MKAFHGTTADAFAKILADGFIGGNNREIWVCSEPNSVYFWGGSEDSYMDEDEAFHMAHRNAYCGLMSSKDCRRVVLELNIEGLEFSEDQSCEHMEGAFVHYGQIPVNRIVKVWEDEEDLSWYRMDMLSTLVCMPLFNSSDIPEHVVKRAEELSRIYTGHHWMEDICTVETNRGI